MAETRAAAEGRTQPVSLEGKDIHLAFGPNAVLRGMDIDVPAGTTVAVIGPSGSGKSTLLRTLNRLYEPDRGENSARRAFGAARQPRPIEATHRHGLPAFQSLPAPQRARQRDAGAAQTQAPGRRTGPRTRPGPTGTSWSAAQGRCAPRHPVRRTAATGRHRPRTGDDPAGDVLRRSDLGAGPGVGQGHPGAHRRPRRRRHDDGRGHPRDGFARSTADTVVFMDHGQVVESGTPEQIFDAAETERLQRFLSQFL